MLIAGVHSFSHSFMSWAALFRERGSAWAHKPGDLCGDASPFEGLQHLALDSLPMTTSLSCTTKDLGEFAPASSTAFPSTAGELLESVLQGFRLGDSSNSEVALARRLASVAVLKKRERAPWVRDGRNGASDCFLISHGTAPDGATDAEAAWVVSLQGFWVQAVAAPVAGGPPPESIGCWSGVGLRVASASLLFQYMATIGAGKPHMDAYGPAREALLADDGVWLWSWSGKDGAAVKRLASPAAKDLAVELIERLAWDLRWLEGLGRAG